MAFTAYSGSHGYSNEDTVLFANIITNLGGHYDTSTSKFTWPMNGTYMFAVNFLSSMGERMHVEIMREGTILVRGLVENNEDEFNTGSAMVITACSAQEQVWVRSLDTGNMQGSRYSYFSGFLLHPGV